MSTREINVHISSSKWRKVKINGKKSAIKHLSDSEKQLIYGMYYGNTKTVEEALSEVLQHNVKINGKTLKEYNTYDVREIRKNAIPAIADILNKKWLSMVEVYGDSDLEDEGYTPQKSKQEKPNRINFNL